MNKNVFIAIIDWLESKKGRRIIIPLNDSKYSPQILVEDQYIVNGSSWSVFCLNYEMIDTYKTKAYIKYLNQNDAPDNLRIGSKFELQVMGDIVATGEIIDISKTDF